MSIWEEVSAKTSQTTTRDSVHWDCLVCLALSLLWWPDCHACWTIDCCYAWCHVVLGTASICCVAISSQTLKQQLVPEKCMGCSTKCKARTRRLKPVWSCLSCMTADAGSGEFKGRWCIQSHDMSPEIEQPKAISKSNVPQAHKIHWMSVIW